MIFADKQNRKWEKRPQLYRGRFFMLRQFSQFFLALAGFCVFIALFLYFQKSDVLLVKKFQVSGTLTHLSQADVEILSEVVPMQSLYRLDLAAIEQKIRRHPWVKSATVRREFPDTIQVHVRERKPMALLRLDRLYLIDDQGIVFKPLEEGDSLDLPIISGFSRKRVDKAPHLSRRELSEVLGFLNFIGQTEFFKSQGLSEIIYDSVAGFTVYTLQDAIEIYYGSNNYQSKHNKLETFSKTKYFDAKRYTRLDLDVSGRVVAREAKVTNVDGV